MQVEGVPTDMASHVGLGELEPLRGRGQVCSTSQSAISSLQSRKQGSRYFSEGQTVLFSIVSITKFEERKKG